MPENESDKIRIMGPEEFTRGAREKAAKVGRYYKKQFAEVGRAARDLWKRSAKNGRNSAGR